MPQAPAASPQWPVSWPEEPSARCWRAHRPGALRCWRVPLRGTASRPRVKGQHKILLSGSEFNGDLVSLKPSQRSPCCRTELPRGDRLPSAGAATHSKRAGRSAPTCSAPAPHAGARPDLESCYPCWATQELGDPEVQLPFFFFFKGKHSISVMAFCKLSLFPPNFSIILALPKTAQGHKPK